MFRRSLDILILCLLTIITFGVVASGVSDFHQLAWVGILMALVLPGYAFSIAVLPELDHIERLVCSVGISLLLDVAGGLVLTISPLGLQPIAWVIWLGGITFISGAVAWVRRGTRSSTIPPALWEGLDWRAVLGFGIAIGILTIALFTALFAAQQNDLPFTQLWALPIRDQETCSLKVGITNAENKPMEYRLYIESGGRYIQDQSYIALKSTEQWTTQVKLPGCPIRTIQALLYRLDQPLDPYRTVHIVPASFTNSQEPSSGQ